MLKLRPKLRTRAFATTPRLLQLPINTVVKFVPQQEAWICERMGKFDRILPAGLNILFPILDQIAYVQTLKEVAVQVGEQSAITRDNVTLRIDGVLYYRVVDAYKVRLILRAKRV